MADEAPHVGESRRAAAGRPPTSAPEVIHASAVSLGAAGLLILGPSGAGKSSLALMLMAWGARLVSDDNTLICRRGGGLLAAPVAATSGLIEARGIGILRADAPQPATMTLAVDLGQVEDARLPPLREIRLHDVALPLVLGPFTPHLAAALLQYLRHSRHA